MAEVCTTQRTTSTTNSRWSRRDVADAIFEFRTTEDDLGVSQRQFAKQQGIPTSTFQRWAGRVEAIDEPDRPLVEQVIEQCAQLFQRSDSCVEGRNSHLDLFHHGHHRLGDRQLKAKTVVHNYLKRRPDGSTAAERFFGEKPHDLFEWLLERLEPPPWPSKPRRRFLN